MTAKNVDACLDTIASQDPRAARLTRMQTLNDRLRRDGKGGRVLVTDGVLSRGLDFARAALGAVTRFDDFNGDNDPWGEHDCACVKVGHETVIWKIDYYDKSTTVLSPDPADPSVTVRVLTIMLAQEY